MGQPSQNKLVVLEELLVAASMGKQRKPENPEVQEQNQQQRVRQSNRQRRNQQKQPTGQEVTRSIPSQLPERVQRRAKVRLANLDSQEPTQPNLSVNEGRHIPAVRSPVARLGKQDVVASKQLDPSSLQVPRLLRKRSPRRASSSIPTSAAPTLPKAVPIKPMPSPPTKLPPASPTRTNLQHLRLGSENTLPRPNLRAVRGIPLPSITDTGRRGNAGAIFGSQASQRFPSQPDSLNQHQEQNRPRVAPTASGATDSVGKNGSRGVRQNPSAQTVQTRKNRTVRRQQKRPASPWLYVIRLLIVGIGIGAIAGTLLSALDPTSQASMKATDAKTEIQESPTPVTRAMPMPLGSEILPLKSQLQTLLPQNSTLEPGVFIVDLDTGAYLDWNSDSTFASASTIKLPILIAFFQDIDEGKIRLDELLTMQPEMIAGGSGDMQYKQPGTQYSALEVATKMIVISDNTATNMLIARLGGAEALNQRFRSWGLTQTGLRNPLPDIEGTNTTSPNELARLMSLVNQGELVTLRSRDRLLDIMQRTETNSMLPKGLGAGATIAHKTGTIGELLADIGLVDMPSGKRYIISVMVKRPHNEATAEELIRQISRLTYEYFNQPRPTPSTTSMPLGSTATISRAIASANTVN